MNVLSKILDDAGRSRQIGYHPRCEDLGITHLCFADDLLVFIEGTKSSLDGVVAVLKYFEQISGLTANMEKSTMFVAGMNTTLKQEICGSFPIAEGSLPVRYLGLPLLAKRMGTADYGPLLERIRTKMSTWTTRFLSYAGRMQLIRSVIFSMVNFWQSAFCLPSKCLQEIESLCSAFLWDGPSLLPKRARVAWKYICLPKNEGGLGFRPLKETSKVCCLKLIWRIVSKADSLWVKWIHSYILKGDSLWSFRETNLGSWIFKKLLKLRPLASVYHKIQVHSGADTSFWYDHWSSKGRLIDLVGSRGVIDLGISINDSVLSVLPSHRRRNHRQQIFKEIEEEIISLQLRRPEHSNMQDQHLWLSSDSKFRRTFSPTATWRNLRESQALVSWSNNVWFRHATPKFAFIQWLAYLNRLHTKDQIKVWNSAIDTNCILCSQFEETRNHLFFMCHYSRNIWWLVAGRLLGELFSTDWDNLGSLANTLNREKVRLFLVRYAMQASIYSIWFERNRRRHGGEEISANRLASQIKRMITNRLSLIIEEGDKRLRNALRLWFSVSD